MSVLLRMSKKSKFFAKFAAKIYLFVPAKGRNAQINKKNIEETINKYFMDAQNYDKKYSHQLRKDMVYSYLHYNISPTQYYLFGFERLSDLGRKEFVGSDIKKRLAKSENSIANIFKNKYKAYEMFKHFYHREMIEVKDQIDHDAFIAFTQRHRKFIIKPEAEGKGCGVERINLDNDITAEEIFKRIISDNSAYVIEECIEQNNIMREIHPESVNTVRIVTYLREDGTIAYLFSMLRMGCGNSWIDNASAGGIAAAIDLKTGIVSTCGWREDLTNYLTHPDTGVQIIGLKIPAWDKLLSLVDELVHIVPEQRYVGWDLAYTNEGWIMVEGNNNAMITAVQMCERKGLRPILEEKIGSNVFL